MKARILFFAVAILLIAFSANSVLMAQSKETTKTANNNLKQTEQKLETKTIKPQEKIHQNKPELKDKAKEVEKSEKNEMVNKTEQEKKEMTHKKMHSNKMEEKKTAKSTEKK